MDQPRPHPRTAAALRLAAATAAAAAAVGCSSSPPTTPAPAAEADPAATTDRALSADQPVRSHRDVEARRRLEAHMQRLKDAAEDNLFTLEGVPDADAAPADPAPDTPPPGELETASLTSNLAATVTADDEPSVEGIARTPTPAPIGSADGQSRSASDPAPTRSPAERVDALAADLAEAIVDEGAADYSPVPAMVRLATLDLLSPGVFNTAFPGFDAGGADASSAMTEEDIALVAAWRDLFEDLRAALSAAGADLDAVADASAELERAAAEWRTLDIPTFALCRRVEGFGVYTPFPANAGTYKLLAGRRHALVVYAEADHFTRRPVTRNGADAFEVALTQTLTLFHAGTPRVAADRDLVAWRTEPQRIADVSRRQRRDFYTVQVIRLPASLSVGSYRLKISIVDDASGETAEALLNIDVVADASAFESGLTIAPARDTPAR